MREVTKTENLFDREITVSLTLKELAIIYAYIANSSTAEADSLIENHIVGKINVMDGDVPYRLYQETKAVLTNNGVRVVE